MTHTDQLTDMTGLPSTDSADILATSLLMDTGSINDDGDGPYSKSDETGYSRNEESGYSRNEDPLYLGNDESSYSRTDDTLPPHHDKVFHHIHVLIFIIYNQCLKYSI